MQFINPIKLISVDKKATKAGDIKSTPKERRVLAHISSIKQSEFYQAAATGMKPEITFIVRSFDYKGEVKVNYNSSTYNIIRTYCKDDGTTEIICSRGVNNGSTS